MNDKLTFLFSLAVSVLSSWAVGWINSICTNPLSKRGVFF